MALVALQYLGCEEVAEPVQGLKEDEEFDLRLRKYPFLTYAYHFWGDYVADAGDDAETQQAASRYLHDPKRIASFQQAVCYLNTADTASWDVRKGANSIHVAAWFGLGYAISGLVEEGFFVNAQDPAHGLTPLILACRRGQVVAVIELLGHGASVNAHSRGENTALLEAVDQNYPEVVRLLLGRNDLEVNESRLHDNERTALMRVATEGHLEILDDLLGDERIDVNQADLDGNTALSLATIGGNSTAVQALLAHPKINVNATNSSGNTALILAVKKGREDIADLLLEAAADASIKDHEGGGTGYINIIHTLMKYNVSIYVKDEQNRSLLHGQWLRRKWSFLSTIAA